MYVLKMDGRTPNIPFRTYVCDTEADLPLIVTESNPRPVFGSEAYVIESQKTYILNSSYQWKEKPASSSGGSVDPDEVIWDGGEEV